MSQNKYTHNIEWYDTLRPYDTIPYSGIQYTTCRDYDHISRYKGLRQVIHNADDEDRFVALETSNPFSTNVEVNYYKVPSHEENRLDVLAYRFLGNAQYSWIIAYFNGIEDGFTCREGQVLAIPKNMSSLFNSGELLATIPATYLNLGTE